MTFSDFRVNAVHAGLSPPRGHWKVNIISPPTSWSPSPNRTWWIVPRNKVRSDNSLYTYVISCYKMKVCMGKNFDNNILLVWLIEIINDYLYLANPSNIFFDVYSICPLYQFNMKSNPPAKKVFKNFLPRAICEIVLYTLCLVSVGFNR